MLRPTGFGSPGVPGLYTGQQVAGWRKVVDAVRARGGVIFLSPYNRKTFYGGDVAGYTDYPAHDELAQA